MPASWISWAGRSSRDSLLSSPSIGRFRESAGLIDLSCSGTFELKGDDRTRFLHGMVTNDIKALTPGAGCYAAFLSPQGRMITDLRVFCSEESFILSTEPAGREKLGPSLRKYIIGDRPLLLDRSEEMALLVAARTESRLIVGQGTFAATNVGAPLRSLRDSAGRCENPHLPRQPHPCGRL